MEKPSETVPRAIGVSVLFSTVVYVLVGLSALGLVDSGALGGSQAPLATVWRGGARVPS